MSEREYYAIRKGYIKKDEVLNFETFKKAFQLIYKRFYKDGYFQKYFGISCTDGFIEGVLGDDIDTVVFIKTGKQNLFPVYKYIDDYSEDDLYTLIEFLYDYCSKPTETSYHGWNDCGIHVEKSDDSAGKLDFRNEINPLLKRYKNYELSNEGEILEGVDEGFEKLLNASIPNIDSQNITLRIETATLKFRRAKSTLDDRRDALRDLADVLEFLKPKIKIVLMSKDEKDLFEIANTFGIRHHNIKQRNEYDKSIWHSWIFYCYLATIHVCLRLIEKQSEIK